MTPLPTLIEEQFLWNRGYEHVIGMDEVGRGAFAGPVVTAGVVFSQTFRDTEGIHDSKLLSAQKRESLISHIHTHARYVAIACISVETINEIGIGKATTEAFQQVLRSLYAQFSHTSSYVLLDGSPLSTLCCGINKQKAIIKGDQKSISIAAASVIAKVYRDRLMKEIHATYPPYNFAQNKGYGTLAHRQAITSFGLSPIHRTSFDLSLYY